MTDAEAAADLESRFMRERRVVHFVRQPVFGTSIADLDRRRLVDYFVRVRDQDLFDTPKAQGTGAQKNRTMRVSQPERSHSYEFAAAKLVAGAVENDHV